MKNDMNFDPILDFNNWKILTESLDKDIVDRISLILNEPSNLILMYLSYQANELETENFINWLNHYPKPIVLCQLGIPYLNGETINGYYVLLDKNKVLVMSNQQTNELVYFLVQEPIL